MKLKSYTSSTITTETCVVEKDGEEFTYIEYLNDKGKLIDLDLRDSSGYEVSKDNHPNPAGLLEEIQHFLGSKQNK